MYGMKQAGRWLMTGVLAALLGVAWALDDPQDALQLIGSIAGKAGQGVALVKHRPTSAIKAIRVGEDVFGFGKLLTVDRYAMVLRPGTGQPITISSRFGGAGKKLARSGPKVNTDDKYIEDGFQRIGNKIEVDARYRDRVLKEELPKILMEASSEPVMEGGTIAGFRLFQIDQDSMFSKLGIKEGDVVKEINGVPLNNVARTVQLLNGMRGEPNVKVNVMRNGTPVTLELNVR